MPARSPDERIATLEHVVATLSHEVRRLHARLDQLDAAASRSPSSARPSATETAEPRFAATSTSSGWQKEFRRIQHAEPRPASPRPTGSPAPHYTGEAPGLVFPEDIASALSRHGLALLAALVFLSGLGLLIRWAVREGHFGPSAQLLAGAALTVAFYALGGWLWRQRSERRTYFAPVVLSLALAATHILAWGAGPRLHLIPAPAALALAAICSVALGALALRSNDRTLFSVGVVGTLAAPLLAGVPRTSAGAMAVVVYLAAAFAMGVFAVGVRQWSFAMRTLGAGLLLYSALLGEWTAASSTSSSVLGSWRPVLMVAVPFTAVLATRALPATLLQVAFARLATVIIAVVAFSVRSDTAQHLIPITLGLVALFWCVDERQEPHVDAEPGSGGWRIPADGILVPGLLLGGAFHSQLAPGATGGWLRACVVTVVVTALAVSLRPLGDTSVARARAVLILIGAALAAYALPGPTHQKGMLVLAATSLTAVLLAVLVPRRDEHAVARGALFGAWMVWGTIVAWALAAVVAAGYTRIPGASWPLATLFIAVLSAGVLVATSVRTIPANHRALQAPGRLVVTGLVVWGWIALHHWRSELASTTGAIIYEAAVGAGLLAVALTRPHAFGVLRSAGLWVLGFAGVHTLVKVWKLDDDLIKVLVTLVVGSVLLTTAYLTRRNRTAVHDEPSVGTS